MPTTSELFQSYQAFGTAIVSFLGILHIMFGSSLYAKNQAKKASTNILIGNLFMGVAAFGVWNPLFAIPEIATILTALLPFLVHRSKAVKDLAKQCHFAPLLVLIALALGTYTLLRYVTTPWESLPVLGLTFLAVGFAIGDNPRLTKTFRACMMSGGTLLVIGSVHGIMVADSPAHLILALAFLTLNAIFLINEFRLLLHEKRPA